MKETRACAVGRLNDGVAEWMKLRRSVQLGLQELLRLVLLAQVRAPLLGECKASLCP